MSPVISTAMHYSHDRKQIDFRDYLKNRSQFFFNQCQCWTDSFDAALFCLFLRVSICVNRWYVAVDPKYFYSSCFYTLLWSDLVKYLPFFILFWELSYFGIHSHSYSRNRHCSPKCHCRISDAMAESSCEKVSIDQSSNVTIATQMDIMRANYFSARVCLCLWGCVCVPV